MSFAKTVTKSRAESRKDTRKVVSMKPVDHYKPFKARPALHKQEVVMPDDFIPPAINIQKFAIKENMKFINLGMRPQKLPITKT